jgi:zinc transport system substrate-binding protein
MAQHIYEALASVDPLSEPYYRVNRDAVLANITAMDSEITRILDKIPQRKFISAHGSWGYFARDYRLTQVVIEQSGKEPTAKDIETLINAAREEGTNIIITEPEFSRKAADVIASSINGSVITADPLAPEIPDEIRTLAMALSRTGPS